MKSLVLTVCLLGTISVIAKAAGVNFPTATQSVSPDGHWIIRCHTVQHNGGWFEHTLLLHQDDSMYGTAIWTSGRNCDVLWDNSGRRVAITDWSGSNLAEIFLVDITKHPTAAPLNIDGIRTIVRPEELDGHCYYEALAWVSDHQLSIRVFGHTDTNPSHGFCYYLSVDTATGHARLVSKKNEEPNLSP